MMAFFLKLVRAVSLNRVLLWGGAGVVALVLFTVYENRGRISAAALTPRMSNPVGLSFKIGQETRTAIEARVKNDRSIIGIYVMSADLRSNEARSVFFFGTDATLNAIDRSSRASGHDSLPMFTSDEKHNISTIRLINGQFSCTKFPETLLSKIHRDLNVSVKAICSSSIPSYYGYFSGYLTVFLGAVPTPEQELHLKIVIEKLSTDIYFRDVLSTQFQDQPKLLSP